MPRALISDEGSYFINRIITNAHEVQNNPQNYHRLPPLDKWLAKSLEEYFGESGKLIP